MRIKLFAVCSSIAMCLHVVGCSGGGDSSGNGSGGNSQVCSTLKIAGGAECFDAPRAIVVVRTSKGYCSGTFISKRHVLTGAHCFSDSGASDVRILSQYFSYTASKVQTHPAFNPSVPSDQNDVAVVTLASDAAVTPVPLLLSRGVKSGDSAVIYGFGLDQQDDTYQDRLMNGDAALKATSLDIVEASDRAVVSISDGSGDTCQGDSGGALLMTGSNGRPGIIAIVRAGPLPCQAAGGASDNTNLQAASVLDFVTKVVPGVLVN